MVAFEPGRMTSVGVAGDAARRAARTPDRRPARAAADRSRRSWRCADRRARRSVRCRLPRLVVGRPSASSAGSAMRRRRRTARGRAPASRCARAMSLHAVVEQRRVAAELVDDEARDHRRVGRIDHRLGADEAGDHAAAVDVADQHDRHVGRARKAHVGDVAGAQVDLRRRLPAPSTSTRSASAARLREALQHGAAAAWASSPGIRAPWQLPTTRPCTTTCAPDLALRLQQHRVHVRRSAARRRRAPAAPGPGRSRRRRR